MASTYPAFRDALLELTSTVTSSRSAELDALIAPPPTGLLPSLDTEDLQKRVSAVWAEAKFRLDAPDVGLTRRHSDPDEGLVKNGESSKSAVATPSAELSAEDGHKKEGTGKDSKNGTKKEVKVQTAAEKLETRRDYMRLDIIKGWMDLAGRDLVVMPMINGELEDSYNLKAQCLFVTALQDRLDIILTLYETVFEGLGSQPAWLEPGFQLMLVIEELGELVSIESWRVLWSWIEMRSTRFLQVPYASGLKYISGKVRPFLRIVNTLLRSLSRTQEDLVLRGRVHQFASGIIPIAQRAVVNDQGFFAPLDTEWDTFDDDEGLSGGAGVGADAADEGQGGGVAGADEDVEMAAAAGTADPSVDDRPTDGDKSGDDTKSVAAAGKSDKEARSNDPTATSEPIAESAAATDTTADAAAADKLFYTTLWSLQAYFANPALLSGPAAMITVPVPATSGDDKPGNDKAGSASHGKGEGGTKWVEKLESPLDTFRRKTELVLPVLYEQTRKEKAQAALQASRFSGVLDKGQGRGKTEGSNSALGESRKRKRHDPLSSSVAAIPAASTQISVSDQVVGHPSREGPGHDFFHPRYLTAYHLLPYSLADISFRRQILMQFMILFQFLRLLKPDNKYTSEERKLAPLGGIPRGFKTTVEYHNWVFDRMTEIAGEMAYMCPDGRGKDWKTVALSIFMREARYTDWKNDGASEELFEVPPANPNDTAEPAEAWAKRQQPPTPWPYRTGTRALSMLWRDGFEGMDQLKGWKRKATFDGLRHEIKAMVDDVEDDKAFGKVQTPEEERVMAEKITKLNWRAVRLASRVNLRDFSKMAGKRDVNDFVAQIEEAEAKVAKAEEERAANAAAGVTAGGPGVGAGDMSSLPATPIPAEGTDVQMGDVKEAEAGGAGGEDGNALDADADRDGIQTPPPASPPLDPGDASDPTAELNPTAQAEAGAELDNRDEAENDEEAILTPELPPVQLGTIRGSDEVEDLEDRDEADRKRVKVDEGDDVDMDARRGDEQGHEKGSGDGNEE